LKVKRTLLPAALTLIVGAAFFLLCWSSWPPARNGFVETKGSYFVIDGRPFRFVGANTLILPGQMEQAARAGLKVVRLWALGEGPLRDKDRLPDPPGSPPTYPYRWSPDNWNEEAFRQLDRVIAEAAQYDLRVQLCLTNWWRDTGGVTQYLTWAGIEGADDDNYPYGINFERAMLFYTNDKTRSMYRQHLERLATRRNTVTGVLYRDDPTIFGWELMNEAQAVTGRWHERRAWIAEMSSYLKRLDPNHLISPGDWGYRSAVERREWIVDHSLPDVDYCDIHLYPIDDDDSFVDSPAGLQTFIDNRAAAAAAVNKPLVFGEFGMEPDGYKGFSQLEWFRAFFEGNTRVGGGGTMFWILTPDPKRRYSVTPTARDEKLLVEIKRASWLIDTYQSTPAPAQFAERQRFLVPHQTGFARATADAMRLPKIILQEDRTLLYRFRTENVASGQFEKLGEGKNYIWGSGPGHFEFVVPQREDRRRVSQIVVRARIQPVVPSDARPESIKTRVTLWVNGFDCGSRLIPSEDPKQPLVQEWVVTSFPVRVQAMRGLPLSFRFMVGSEADWPYGLSISTWPAGIDSGEKTPIEVEVRR
jgi:mannan endo-1,4-beta-mannosidase